jgi:hypothetical protein
LDLEARSGRFLKEILEIQAGTLQDAQRAANVRSCVGALELQTAGGTQFDDRLLGASDTDSVQKIGQGGSHDVVLAFVGQELVAEVTHEVGLRRQLIERVETPAFGAIGRADDLGFRE